MKQIDTCHLTLDTGNTIYGITTIWIRHVRDIECMGNISKMAERAFATGGDKSQIKLLFEPYRYLDSHNVYYLWLVVREGNEYRTVSYNRFVGDFVHHEAEPAIDSGFIDEE